MDKDRDEQNIQDQRHISLTSAVFSGHKKVQNSKRQKAEKMSKLMGEEGMMPKCIIN